MDRVVYRHDAGGGGHRGERRPSAAAPGCRAGTHLVVDGVRYDDHRFWRHRRLRLNVLVRHGDDTTITVTGEQTQRSRRIARGTVSIVGARGVILSRPAGQHAFAAVCVGLLRLGCRRWSVVVNGAADDPIPGQDTQAFALTARVGTRRRRLDVPSGSRCTSQPTICGRWPTTRCLVPYRTRADLCRD